MKTVFPYNDGQSSLYGQIFFCVMQRRNKVILACHFWANCFFNCVKVDCQDHLSDALCSICIADKGLDGQRGRWTGREK